MVQVQASNNGHLLLIEAQYKRVQILAGAPTQAEINAGVLRPALAVGHPGAFGGAWCNCYTILGPIIISSFRSGAAAAAPAAPARMPSKIFDSGEDECAVCYDNKKAMVFVPCGERCLACSQGVPSLLLVAGHFYICNNADCVRSCNHNCIACRQPFTTLIAKGEVEGGDD
jgi:hypothetical protein